MNLGNTLETLGEREKSARLMKEALSCMRGAVEAYQQAGEGYWLPIAQKRVTEVRAELAKLQR